MSARKGKAQDEHIASTLRAAELFVDGVDEPISAEEAAIIEEVRRELPRPSKATLEALAKKLANSGG